MFKKILIANRGEIAVRIIRTCKEMGIKTVAVYSDVDEESIHVHMADEAICIGPAQAKDSYLNIDRIICAALVTKAEAIHPGYGFLSENKDLIDACIKNNIRFIGPDKRHLEVMGDKSQARNTMVKAGVPVVPGTEKSTNDAEEAFEMAKEIGYPLIIKAASGGGGRGMRIVHEEKEFIRNFNTAKAEAMAGFNDDSMYLERLIENPRHIEVQILADSYGNVIHLGERDCSLQRRNQKVIEEAPCSIISQELREKIGQVALKAAKAVEYVSAGTIEFLLDRNNDFYFMEMNTRIQVEHPVTEQVTGIDIIREQIKIAYGEKLDLTQEDIGITGHAIECRINAENPRENFRPCPGKIETYFAPGGYGIRIDTHIYADYTVPATYDSMVGKLIVWGKDRTEAIGRMRRALDEMVILGIDTNIDFHKEILNNEEFNKNKIDTSFIEKEIFKRE
ncbi:MAG: acetyl-CoA carboxylase biotin carboxylase subunit [Tissierellaceae bacterium]|jgi:acetyl-CoA carboxylase biotin carboxylase subunit|nr:acetyl-CoA carboxylase biotin carboxylase subunit [Tissierellia bacterium]